MAALKQEILITRITYKITAKFQRLSHVFKVQEFNKAILYIV